MRSDNVTKGVERAPNRSLFYALGYTKEELERPLIGVVCSYNEIVPGHMNLDKIAEAVKAGVRAAGGTPVEFPAIAVCDGIAMGHIGMKYSLVTRDLIADSTEAMAIAHQFDGGEHPHHLRLRRPHAGRSAGGWPPLLPEPHVRGRGRLQGGQAGRGGCGGL